MFVKIEGSYINLDLVHTIDLNDDGTATLWFTGTGVPLYATEADLSVIVNAIRHECAFEEIESPAPRLKVDLWKGHQKSKRGPRKPHKSGGKK